MPKTPSRAFRLSRSLGIEVSTISHPPLFTVADLQALRGEIAGGHTKNLFLKDKKDNSSWSPSARRRRSTSSRSTNSSAPPSRVSFGKPEALMELLGVTPGAVTVFGLINDRAGRGQVGPRRGADGTRRSSTRHPLTNEATTSIARPICCAFVAGDRARASHLESLGLIATWWRQTIQRTARSTIHCPGSATEGQR